MPNKPSVAVTAALYLLMLSILLLFLFPFGIAFVNSFKPLSEIVLDPLSLPTEVLFSNYALAWNALKFPLPLYNTAIITLTSVFALVVLTSMSSYWISRHSYGLNKAFEQFIIGSALIPFATIMLPLVLVIRTVKLTNTYFAGILTYVGIGFPLAYLIMRGAVQAIPLEMDEAAKIDGCSVLQTFFQVIFPLIRATVATVVISSSFWVWNEFQIALIFLNTGKLQTIQLAINSMFGQFSTRWDVALPGLLISVVPIVCVFLSLQKYIIAGVLGGAVKS